MFQVCKYDPSSQGVSSEFQGSFEGVSSTIGVAEVVELVDCLSSL